MDVPTPSVRPRNLLDRRSEIWSSLAISPGVRGSDERKKFREKQETENWAVSLAWGQKLSAITHPTHVEEPIEQHRASMEESSEMEEAKRDQEFRFVFSSSALSLPNPRTTYKLPRDSKVHSPTPKEHRPERPPRC